MAWRKGVVRLSVKPRIYLAPTTQRFCNLMDALTPFNSPFLVIDGETLSLAQVLKYFQLSGKLFPFIREIVEQHVLFQEIQQRSDLEVSLVDLEQTIIDFRLQRDLTDGDRFQDWLTQQGMERLTFQNQVLLRLKLEKLVAAIAEPQLPQLFAEQQEKLSTIMLALVVSQNVAALEELTHQLQHQETTVAELSLAYAGNPEVRISQGMIRLGNLPLGLQAAVEAAPDCAWVGPIEIDSQWSSFQVQERIPANLDETLKQELQLTLFQQWLGQQVQARSVRLANQPVIEPLQQVFS